MLERARQRAAEEGITNVDFVQADAQVHPFSPESFDLVVSRFGVMFFADPVAAFTNLAHDRDRVGGWRSCGRRWPERVDAVSRAALALGR